MCIAASIVQHGIPECRLFHDLRQRIPRTEIFPRTAITEHANVALMLDNGIVEADLLKTLIRGEKPLIIRTAEKPARPCQHIA